MFSRIKSLSNACAPDLQQHQQEPDASSAPESMSEQQPRSPEYGTSPTSSEDLQLHPLHEIHRHQEEPPAQTFNYNTATYLMGGSGVSLDGRSLVLPMDRDREFDEVSSINTGHYTHEMRIVADAGPDVEYANHQNDNDDHDYEGPIGAGGMSPGTDDGMLKNGTNSNSFEYHTARPNKRDAKTMDSDSYEGGCLPLWITDAPRWLKIVIVLSTALLVGAIVLIGVGASLAVQKNNGGTEAVQKTNPSGPNQQPVASPTGDSTSGNFPTASPPTGNAPTTPGGTDDGDDSAAAPVASPTEPASTPQQPTTTAPPPTASPTASSVSFYVTGGRFTGDALADLPQQLNSLPYMDDNTVMFHLGDWNSPFATSCVEESYQTNVDLFSNSTVPVYFVPGDNEYNDCPDPEQAFLFWDQYLLGYETQFWPASDQWNVTRQEPDYAENFAYVFNGVLFVGINLVGGLVHDNREWQDRHQADLRWIDEQYYLNEGNFDVMVILAHADPDIQANDNFFETFYERVEFNYDLQVLFVHRNLGTESWGLEPQFNSIQNLMVVVVEGSVWPPMIIQMDTKAGTVDIDQGTWYQDYISSSGNNA